MPRAGTNTPALFARFIPLVTRPGELLRTPSKRSSEKEVSPSVGIELLRRHGTGVVNSTVREHEDGPTPSPRSARPPRSGIVSGGPGPVHAPFGPFRPALERSGARKSPAAQEGGYGPPGPRVFYYPAERGDDHPLPAPKELPRPRSRRTSENTPSTQSDA